MGNKLVAGAGKRGRRRKVQWAGLVFVSPLLAGLLFVFLQMMVSGVRFAFSDVSVQNGLQFTFAGLENFHYALRVDADFVKYLAEDLRSLVTTAPIILVFSRFIAVVLNTKVWGRTAFRALFFLPVIACTGLLSMMDSENMVMSVMNSATANQDSTVLGALGNASLILQQLNFSPALIQGVTGAANNLIDVVNRSGVQILIFLAGIQSIPVSVYESAKVEGASAWSSFWKITLPMVVPYVLVNVVYTFIESLTRDNTRLMDYLKYVACTKGKYGYSSAMAWIHFLCIAVLMAALLLLFWLFTRAYRKSRKEGGR